MELEKYKVIIKEIIVHTVEVEAVNEYMAKEQAKEIVKGEIVGRLPINKGDIFLQKEG